MPGAIAPPTYCPLRADHVEGRRGAEVDDDRRTAVQRGGGERVDDPVGADLARVVHQHRYAGPHARLDDDAAARRRSGARSMSRHSCSTAGHRRAHRRCRRSVVDRRVVAAARAAAPPTRRPCGARRSRPASGRCTSPSSSSPRTVWLLPMSAQSSGIMAPRRSMPMSKTGDRVGQRADRDEVDAGRGDLAGPVEGEPAARPPGWPGRPVIRDRLGHLLGRSCCRAGSGRSRRRAARAAGRGRHLDLDGEVGVARADRLVAPAPRRRRRARGCP